MRKQIQKPKKKNYKMVLTPCPPPPTHTHTLTHPNINQAPPHLFHPPSICNNNTMGMEFLVQIRQCNKCGSARNDEIINLHVGSEAGP